MLNNRDMKRYTKRRVQTEKFFDYEFNNAEISEPILEEESLNFLNQEKSLKFYNLSYVDLEEENYESLMIKILSTVSQKKKTIQRHDNIWLPKNLKDILNQ